MSWTILFDESTGRMISQGTVIVDPLPRGVSRLDLADKPLDSQMWDEASRIFVPRPAKVLGDVYDDSIVALKTRGVVLLPIQEAAIKQVLIDIIGSDRFYNAAVGWTKRESASRGR